MIDFCTCGNCVEQERQLIQMMLTKILTLVLQSTVERTCPHLDFYFSCLDLYFVVPGELV